MRSLCRPGRREGRPACRVTGAESARAVEPESRLGARPHRLCRVAAALALALWRIDAMRREALTAMTAAHSLYRGLGFLPIATYNESLLLGIEHFDRPLGRAA